MQINDMKLWGLNVDNIKTLEDVKLIFKVMDLYLVEDIKDFDLVKHLFTEEKPPESVQFTVPNDQTQG